MSMKRREVRSATDWPMHSQGVQCAVCSQSHVCPPADELSHKSRMVLAVTFSGLQGDPDRFSEWCGPHADARELFPIVTCWSPACPHALRSVIPAEHWDGWQLSCMDGPAGSMSLELSMPGMPHAL